MNINVGVVSLGCPKNLVDTEIILGNLSKYGFKIVNKAEIADVIIVNTCGFIDKAKQESINTILEMVEYRMKWKCRALIVIGCLAERYKEDIYREIPEVDAVVGMGQYSELLEIIRDLLSIEKEKRVLFMDDYIHRVKSTPPFISYLKISEGCDNKCSYCVIPAIRGPYKSRHMDEVIEEARHLENHGTKEIIVVAQDTTRYGSDIYGESKLAELLRKISNIEGLKWVRVMYAYPDSITQELIEVMAENNKICKYIDLPIQHISDRVLKAMGRRSSASQIKEVISRLREKMPGIAIRTSVIVGFPGETEEEFNELLEFIETVKFDRLGVFTYSKEEGTPASKMPAQIPYKIKKDRYSKIMKVQKQISKSINAGYVGKEMEVLIEGKTQPNGYFGRTFRDAPEIDGIVYVKSARELKPGSLVRVRINKASQYDLVGGVCDEPCQ